MLEVALWEQVLMGTACETKLLENDSIPGGEILKSSSLIEEPSQSTADVSWGGQDAFLERLTWSP